MMKKMFFLLTIVMFCTNAFSQTVVGTNKKETRTEIIDLLISKKWLTKKVVGENRNTDTYELIPYDKKESFGNALIFKDSVHFHSYYFAFCGLDCFTTVNGHYKRINRNTIELFVNSITHSGTCARPTMYMYDKKYRNLGKFKISVATVEGLTLTKKR